jgi:hypothetical protein
VGRGRKLLIGAVVGVVAVVGFTGVASAVTGSRIWHWGMMGTRAQGQPAGACGSLMSNPDAFKAMLALRQEHLKDMQAWWQRYGSDPSSAAAKDALTKLRQEHRQDMQDLFKKFGITPPRGGMMRSWASPSPGASGGGTYGPGMMGGSGSRTYGPGMMGGDWR